MATDDLKSLLLSIADRLGNIESHLGLENNSSKGDTQELPRSIKGFDAYFAETVEPFVATCQKLGGDATAYGQAVKEAWLEKRAFLLMASQCKEPPQAVLMTKLGGVAAKMKGVSAMIQRNEWEKHGKTCSEGMQALNWLCVKPAPRDFIESYIGGSDYWANGIRKEFRNVNADQIAFCDQFKKILLGLMDYVKEFHTTGVTWNPRGMDAKDYVEGATPAATPAAAPAATPAAKASPATETPKPAATTGAPPVSNLFAEMTAKGGSVTSGLKTVTKDQQTWRAEYAGNAAAPAAAPKKPVVTKRPVEVVKGTPKVEFMPAQSKWNVEYQSPASNPDKPTVTVDIGSIKECVYILGCLNAEIRINGKCKSVILDNCKRCKVTFDTIMASFETVNCQRVHIICLEKVSSVAIDKTDGAIVTLPRSSLDSNILSSKSSEMNVQWYDSEDPEADLIERPIPEQYVHHIDLKTNNITAEVSDLYAH